MQPQNLRVRGALDGAIHSKLALLLQACSVGDLAVLRSLHCVYSKYIKLMRELDRSSYAYVLQHSPEVVTLQFSIFLCFFGFFGHQPSKGNQLPCILSLICKSSSGPPKQPLRTWCDQQAAPEVQALKSRRGVLMMRM